jgi:DNA-binding MarR family transcriptional regulator
MPTQPEEVSMSAQLMLVAANLPTGVVNQSQKLALMKMCDSADDETCRAHPALAGLAAWAGVSESRAATIVTELVAKGLVERIKTGRAGRMVEYRVFPLGVPTLPGCGDKALS